MQSYQGIKIFINECTFRIVIILITFYENKESTNIHAHQLSDIHDWLNEFRSKNTNLNQEVIVFDIICGDFNMDNCSPGICNQKHV